MMSSSFFEFRRISEANLTSLQRPQLTLLPEILMSQQYSFNLLPNQRQCQYCDGVLPYQRFDKHLKACRRKATCIRKATNIARGSNGSPDFGQNMLTINQGMKLLVIT